MKTIFLIIPYEESNHFKTAEIIQNAEIITKYHVIKGDFVICQHFNASIEPEKQLAQMIKLTKRILKEQKILYVLPPGNENIEAYQHIKMYLKDKWFLYKELTSTDILLMAETISRLTFV